MHPAKATSWAFADPREFGDPPVRGELPGPVDGGLPLHAAASRAGPGVAMTAAAVRAAGGHPRRGRRMTRMLWFIMSPQGWMIVWPSGARRSVIPGRAVDDAGFAGGSARGDGGRDRVRVWARSGLAGW
jgi:hypothetical protein